MRPEAVPLARREAIARATATLGAVGLAGCTGLLGRLDGEDEGLPEEPPDDPERPAAWYREWLPAEHPPWVAADLGLARDRATDLPTEYRHRALSTGRSHDYLGVPAADLDGVLWFVRNGLPTVFVGEIDRDAVADTLNRTGYERVEGYADFRCYEREDRRTTAWVGTDALLASQHAPETPEDDPDQLIETRRFVEDLLDRGVDDAADRPDASREATAVAEQFGSWPMTQGVRSGTIELGTDPAQEGHRIADPIDGVDATLLGNAFGGADGWGFAARGYHLPDSVGREGLERLRRHAREESPEATEFWIWRRDAVVEVLAGAPLEDHPSHDPDGPVDVVPQVTVAFELETESERLSIEHLAGDPLSLEHVVLDGDVESREALEGTLEAGDAAVVPVEISETPTTVRLVYESHGASRSTAVASALLDP